MKDFRHQTWILAATVVGCGGLVDGAWREPQEAGGAAAEGGAVMSTSHATGGSETTDTGSSFLAGTNSSNPPLSNCDSSCTPYTVEVVRTPASCVNPMPPAPDGHGVGRTVFELQYANGAGTVQVLAYDSTGRCDSGWRFTPDGAIELCGGTCDSILGNPSGTLWLNVGCTGIVYC